MIAVIGCIFIAYKEKHQLEFRMKILAAWHYHHRTHTGQNLFLLTNRSPAILSLWHNNTKRLNMTNAAYSRLIQEFRKINIKYQPGHQKWFSIKENKKTFSAFKEMERYPVTC